MVINAERYANWKAPSQDGAVLVWPPADQLIQQTHSNTKTLAELESVWVQNVPVAHWRKSIRQWLGHPNEVPLIATGHQSELYHPGVWVKDAVINAIAARANGHAYHFAVDTDQPKHLQIKWPGSTLSVTDDPALPTAEWSGLLASPSPAHVQAIESALTTASSNWNFKPMLGEVLASLRRSAMEEAGLSAAITNAQHELDWQLGLRHHAMLVSPMLNSATYLAFVYHVLSHAGQFAADYNASLAEYRVEAGIKSVMRPMPDLRVGSDTIEVPFWLDDLEPGTRKRADVHIEGDHISLVVDKAKFLLDPATPGEKAAESLAAWLRDHHLRLSPRALTLTTFLRLLVVDQFVHGIGGGRYDQVTDRLLARHFGIDPPTFAVATGTLFFPGAIGRPRVCLPCLLQEGHRLKHAVLGDRKRELLAEINALPRRSVPRSLAFHALHGAMSAAANNHAGLREFEARYDRSVLQAREETVLFDRELFYAMQSKERLLGMIERVNQEVHRSDS
jgi:hypothetical protein